uniref:Uncharacterized protein n=1 Tax=Arundo donax TaxID=35708 RepID=A0A0A9AZB1_ARUDO
MALPISSVIANSTYSWMCYHHTVLKFWKTVSSVLFIS